MSMRVVLVSALAVAVLVTAGIAAGESFGPQPAGSESRCAPVSISVHILDIGSNLAATAGPSTAMCGGTTSQVHWSWQNNEVNENAIPGLVQVSPCTADSTHCEYHARMFTAKGTYNAVCILGTSPDGGFTSCGEYAIRYGHYHAVIGNITNSGGKPIAITLRGAHGTQRTKADGGGNFTFAVKNGTYTLSYTVAGKKVKTRFRSVAKPGTTVGTFSTP